MSSLADRIRGVIGSAAPVTPTEAPARSPQPLASTRIIDQHLSPDARHGRERIGDLAGTLERCADDAVLFAGPAARPPFVFFDLETTGLSGGAGTLAFLVGCAWFDADGGFRTRQILLTRHAGERPLLETAANELARAGALVSFNGKSFDAPLLETRYLFHRLGWVGEGVPHFDVLHPARQFWKHDDCSLTTLERRVIGSRRVGDVPGFEIPARYFAFVRNGDAGPLEPVLEHNRLDLLTLAALTARLLQLARGGPESARDAREAFALGRVYARAGLDDRACEALRHAVALANRRGVVLTAVTADALRLLAITLRRLRRYAEAADCWRQVLDVRGCPAQVAREASEALAIHHEHRDRDLLAAKAFALRSLEMDPDAGWRNAARHRLARLERKLSTESLKFEA
jgi:uncharacterized protein